jgi:hypothetical protein
VARLELRLDDGRAGVVIVTLSRRNLLTLLHKLDMPGSARTITNGYCYLNRELNDRLTLVLRAEDDEAHYGERPEPPGAVHPTSEAYVRRHGGWSPLQG